MHTLIDDVIRVMAGFPRLWAVAGGCAVDLFLGGATRPHADLEVAIFRADQAQLRQHLAAWSFRKVVGGISFMCRVMMSRADRMRLRKPTCVRRQWP